MSLEQLDRMQQDLTEQQRKINGQIERVEREIRWLLVAFIVLSSLFFILIFKASHGN